MSSVGYLLKLKSYVLLYVINVKIESHKYVKVKKS